MRRGVLRPAPATAAGIFVCALLRRARNSARRSGPDPHVIHRRMKLDLPSADAKGGTIPGVRTPITIDGEPMASPHPAPRLGEHTAEILREIGEA